MKKTGKTTGKLISRDLSAKKRKKNFALWGLVIAVNLIAIILLLKSITG
jgi:hypothetical protein